MSRTAETPSSSRRSARRRAAPASADPPPRVDARGLPAPVRRPEEPAERPGLPAAAVRLDQQPRVDEDVEIAGEVLGEVEAPHFFFAGRFAHVCAAAAFAAGATSSTISRTSSPKAFARLGNVLAASYSWSSPESTANAACRTTSSADVPRGM